jgi:starch synthase
MKILFLAAEATPFVKVGGLADVAGELPPVLRSLGAKVRVVLPFHSVLHDQEMFVEHLVDVQIKHTQGHQAARLFKAKIGNHRVYLIDGDPVRAVENVYNDPSRDACKFIFTALAAMESMRCLNWQPDILHAHDWHTAPAVTRLANIRDTDPFWKSVASLLTVHNLPYLGAGGEPAMEFYGIPPADHPALPYWARNLPLPMGLASADWITTVSPTYTQEIQRIAFGHGLEELLRSRSNNLIGILNGIDVKQWNPETDPLIPQNYSRSTVASRSEVKYKLQDHLNLKLDQRIPLISMVSRLDNQKGIEVALAGLEKLLEEHWQFVLLGSGDQVMEARVRSFAESYNERVRAIFRFDAKLARKIYAGADMILIPSRYEPCGLAQMIAMRYGCIPIVSATGGLKDTVTDYKEDPSGTGFVFRPVDPQVLANTIRKAIMVFADQRKWRGLQLRAMSVDFSWERSAQEYFQVYQRAIEERKRLQ